MIHLNDGAGCAEAFVFGNFLHAEDRAHGNVERVADVHDLEFGFGHRPLFDTLKNLIQLVETFRRRGITFLGFPVGLADDVTDIFPDGRLGNEIGVGVWIGIPALAFENPARLSAAGVVPCTRGGFTEGNPLTELRILF